MCCFYQVCSCGLGNKKWNWVSRTTGVEVGFGSGEIRVWHILRLGHLHWAGLGRGVISESFWLSATQWQSRRKGSQCSDPTPRDKGALYLLSVLKWKSNCPGFKNEHVDSVLELVSPLVLYLCLHIIWISLMYILNICVGGGGSIIF